MNKITKICLITSIGVHASLIGLMGGYKRGLLIIPLPISKRPDLALEFVEAPERAVEPKDKKKDMKTISDKTADAKDKIKEEVKKDMTRAKDVHKTKQLAKRSMEMPRPIQPQMPVQELPKPPAPQGMQEEKKIAPQVPSPQQPKVEYDIINIPEVSESIYNAPEDDSLTFAAQEHKIGPYFKQVKKKIERYWLSYLLFKYQNSAPEVSETVVSFKILPSGGVTGIKVLESSGDELFRDFCVASVVNTSPYPSLPENLKDEIKKDGGLNIVFTFRYR